MTVYAYKYVAYFSTRQKGQPIEHDPLAMPFPKRDYVLREDGSIFEIVWNVETNRFKYVEVGNPNRVESKVAQV